MRIIAFLLCMACLQVSAKGLTQEISLTASKVPLKKLMGEIEKQSGYFFLYDQTLELNAKVDVHVQHASLQQVLNLCFKDQGLEYQIVEKNIVIKKKQPAKQATPAVFEAVADSSVIIKGKVQDDKSLPLAGVSIRLTGYSMQTQTDNRGVFTIKAPKADVQLEFSYVGYKTQQLQATGTIPMIITLEADQNKLNEVVVTALGITRKDRSLGYSSQAVKGDNLTLTKEQNAIGSLAGKIAGVQLSGSSGASMGGTQKIQIRGMNSLTGDGQPLIVVDNTPISDGNFAGKNGPDYGNLSQDINPDDIESVNVLKGPAASALYGLRGQYGVVMITTKKGSKNAKAPVVNLSSAFSLEKAGNFLPLQNTYGAGSKLTFATVKINGVATPYVDGTWDESWGPKMDGTLVRQQYSFYQADPDFGKATPFVPHPDNIKDWFVTGHTINNSISMSGGSQASTFRLSYNNTDIRGIEPNTYLRRNNLTFNGSLNLATNLVVTTSFNYAQNKGQRPSQGYYNGSRNFYQWFERSLDMKKLKQYKYADGTFYQWNVNDPDEDGVQRNAKPIDWNNPYFEAYENPSHDNRDRFFGNVGLTYTIIPGLQVSGFVREDTYTQNIDTRNAEGGRYLPSFAISKFQNKEMNYELMAQYTKQFGKFSLAANVGGNILTQNYTELNQATVGGFITPAFFNISNSLERPTVSNIQIRKDIRSAYATATLGWDNTYFLDASLRRDISSALPADNNAYLYPSVSGSFVFSELLKLPALSFGKVRASFAQAGSDLAAYKTNNFYVVGSPYGTDFPVYLPDTRNNANLKPSLGTAYEGGLELRFFKDRLSLNATYYKQVNKNQVLTVDVPGGSGYSAAVINAGEITNNGVEFTLGGYPVKTKDFSWNSSLNFNRNKNKIVSLYPGLNTLQLDMNTYSGFSVYLNANVGEPFGTLVGSAYQRDPKSGKILLDAANLPLYNTTHNFGSVLPKFTGGWQNTFTYKNFDLGAMIDFQSGGQFFSWTQMLSVKSGQAAITAAMNDKGHNVRDPLADGGGVKVNGISAATGQEVTAYVDARNYYRNTLGTKIYENWLYDATYIRMREIRLGYTFSKAQYTGLPFKSINLAFIARNPFMIHQKAPKGLNPAELATGSSSLNWLETGQLATTRSYGISLNVNF
ncbi:SusC/RagA family TonB-linked outer membrane protein [Deminuibacter soli]|nr:SusC/RagA family TonB-linked outer membrane protein [Deminuibacter soli]